MIGLSGGVDSALCAAICTEAFGPKNVLGVLLPAKDSNPADAVVGQSVAEHLGIKWTCDSRLENLLDLVTGYDLTATADWSFAKASILGADQGAPQAADKFYQLATLKLRGRAYLLAAIAFHHQAATCQTLNLTEILMGWYDRWGDAVGDFSLLTNLYKTQVKTLAHFLGLPHAVLTRKAGCGNYPETISDEEEAGMSFEALDSILAMLVGKARIEEIIQVTGRTEKEILRIQALVAESSLKWKVGGTTVAFD